MVHQAFKLIKMYLKATSNPSRVACLARLNIESKVVEQTKFDDVEARLFGYIGFLARILSRHNLPTNRARKLFKPSKVS